jgi:hypothetical protein
MNQKFGCIVHSFDPYIEHSRYQAIRQSNSALATAVKLPVNLRHTFYKLGLKASESDLDLNKIKLGDMLNFNQILDLTESRNKVIDVFKIDIEGPEVSFLQSMDVDYFCKYVKQFVIESHEIMPRDLMYKLEKCFYLFHRDPRFFTGNWFGPTGALTEWQKPDGYLLNLTRFTNENDLAVALYTIGELYFINLNFLHQK